MSYVTRQRDPADERQVRLSLTPAGRQLVEKDTGLRLVDATGLREDFAKVQTMVAQLRDNLLRATADEKRKP